MIRVVEYKIAQVQSQLFAIFVSNFLQHSIVDSEVCRSPFKNWGPAFAHFRIFSLSESVDCQIDAWVDTFDVSKLKNNET